MDQVQNMVDDSYAWLQRLIDCIRLEATGGLAFKYKNIPNKRNPRFYPLAFKMDSMLGSIPKDA